MKWTNGHWTDHLLADAWIILFRLLACPAKLARNWSSPCVAQSLFLLCLLCLVSHTSIFMQNSTVSPNPFSQVNMNMKRISGEMSRGILSGAPCHSSRRKANSSECWQQSSKNLALLMLIHVLQNYIFNIRSFCCSRWFFPLPTHKEDEIKGLPFSKCLN